MMYLSTIGGIHINAQVNIGVELGASYAPFNLYAATVANSSNRIDYLYGINGQVYLSERILLNTRVSYINREDFRWEETCTCPDYRYSAYSQNDINLDLSAMYKLYNKINISFGWSTLKKVNTEYVNTRIDKVLITTFNNYYHGINGGFGIKWNRLYARLVYVRRFKSDELVYFPAKGQNRLDFTLGYNLFMSKAN